MRQQARYLVPGQSLQLPLAYPPPPQEPDDAEDQWPNEPENGRPVREYVKQEGPHLTRLQALGYAAVAFACASSTFTLIPGPIELLRARLRR